MFSRHGEVSGIQAPAGLRRSSRDLQWWVAQLRVLLYCWHIRCTFTRRNACEPIHQGSGTQSPLSIASAPSREVDTLVSQLAFPSRGSVSIPDQEYRSRPLVRECRKWSKLCSMYPVTHLPATRYHDRHGSSGHRRADDLRLDAGAPAIAGVAWFAGRARCGRVRTGLLWTGDSRIRVREICGFRRS